MKAIILVNNNSVFACDGCIFRKGLNCIRDDHIIELLGDCASDSIYQVEEVEVTDDVA